MIERGNAQHFIPGDCNVDGEMNFDAIVESDVNEFEYERGLPNFVYTVGVNASTRVGSGPSAYIDVVTLSDGEW